MHQSSCLSLVLSGRKSYMTTKGSHEQKVVEAGGLGYISSLDGLRACVFLLILVWHVTRVTGWYGVDLFFVLSSLFSVAF